MDDFKGRTVLVTGGSRGLGEAICRRFAAAGCRVAINCANNPLPAEKLAAELPDAFVAQCDISDEAAVEAMFSRIGKVDILVNNARIDPYMRKPEMTDGEWWESVMNVNLKGAYLCGKNALESMKKSRWGRIINISSIWAYQPPNERMLSYAAAKSAMHALSRGFAAIGAPYGITSNVLAPGLIITELLNSRLTPEMLQKELAGIPLGRGASPAEVAESVFNIAGTAFMTGEVVNLNGGALMHP